MIALLCALLSGGFFYLAHGLDSVWQLAWIAPVPLLWLAYGKAPRWQVLAASFAASASGMVYLFQVYGTYILLAAIVMLVVNGVLLGAAVLLARRACDRLPLPMALFAFPAFWTSAEYLESLVSPHGAWGAMGYSQVDWPAAIQLAAITGVHGVTFLLCVFASALALLLRGKRVPGAIGIGLSLAVIVGGYFRLAMPEASTLRVAALADVVDDRITEPLGVAQAYAGAIRAEAGRGVRVFVTPETGVEAEALAPIAAAAARTGSLVVVGTHGRNPARNMAVAFRPEAEPSTYDKRHRLLPGEAVFQPGTHSGYLGNGMATAICKDLDFPATIRADAQSGIHLMMVPANDFGGDGWMHARQAVMRGVEDGFAVLRTAFHGLETITDDRGRLLASARVDHPGFTSIQADVPLGSGTTFYSRFGDLFAWLSLIAAAGLGVAACVRRGAVAGGPMGRSTSPGGRGSNPRASASTT
jgi:apolipoprotein N-acyltransferase